MEPDLYQQALTKFQHSEFETALLLCQNAIRDRDLSTTLLKQFKQIEADCLLELKQAKLAADLYEELELYSQAGFAAILSQDIQRAGTLYAKTTLSSPGKWSGFLVQFLEQANNRQHCFTRDIATPGYLTFRLYFEATYSYFLHYDLQDYLLRFLDYRNQLINVYPEILKDIGSAHLARQEYQQALEYLTEAQNQYSDDAGIYFKSGMAYLGLNQKDKARSCLLNVKKMLPGSTLIEQLLKQVK